jgi:hypothetical protein
MFLIIAFINNFKNIMLIFFLELFGQQTQIWNMIEECFYAFFKKGNLEVILILKFYLEIT